MVKHEKLQRSEKKVFFLLFFLDEKEIIISFANGLCKIGLTLWEQKCKMRFTYIAGICKMR
jgi:hypothetical protein